jgi:hypothetical protein
VEFVNYLDSIVSRPAGVVMTGSGQIAEIDVTGTKNPPRTRRDTEKKKEKLRALRVLSGQKESSIAFQGD